MKHRNSNTSAVRGLPTLKLMISEPYEFGFEVNPFPLICETLFVHQEGEQWLVIKTGFKSKSQEFSLGVVRARYRDSRLLDDLNTGECVIVAASFLPSNHPSETELADGSFDLARLDTPGSSRNLPSFKDWLHLIGSIAKAH